MPRVRQNCTVLGKYGSSFGDEVDITDDEFARWSLTGAVILVDDPPAEPPAVEPTPKRGRRQAASAGPETS